MKQILKPLLTIFSIIFSEFLVMGISLGTIPEFVHETLKMDNIIVGLIIGLQYVATLSTRHLAGSSSDQNGGVKTVEIGLKLSVLAGICCFGSYFFLEYDWFSLGLLAIGRILLGIGESYLVIGIFAWGFVLVGQENTGKVMVWNGLGMQAGMACGAPLGLFLVHHLGMGGSFGALILLPFLGILAAQLLPKVNTPKSEVKLPFLKAVATVWRSGAGLAMASVGFSGIASFITLYYTQQGWQYASIGLSCFGGGYIIMRLFFSHFPDRFGGARVAILCLLIEMTGQLLLWQAPNGTIATLGSALTGCGMSLVFPAFGKMAIKNILPANRGMAMAAYNAFFDLGMGITAPIAGWIAGGVHYEYIYLFGASAAVVGCFLAYFATKEDSLNIQSHGEGKSKGIYRRGFQAD